MTPTPDHLKQLHAAQSLVTLEREGIDDRTIHGFILGYSADLIALRYVFDFHLDGIMVLRTRDISDISTSEAGDFQKQLLQEDGLLGNALAPLALPIESIAAFLKKLPADELVILESEDAEEPQLLVGAVAGVASGSVKVRTFTALGEWEATPASLHLSEITCCQTGTNYLNAYVRHFQRKAGGGKGKPSRKG